MTPAARVQSAIELLDLIITAAKAQGAPADRILAEWFKARRFAGSKDRRAIRELVFAAIRACGPVPPNPAELIGSEQMSNLLKSLQKRFTHVVVDSPPIGSFTDGVLIASLVDGVILVVHSGKSSRQVVRRSRQLLQDINAKVFGVVLNNVNLRSQDNYYYYQSYYHRDYYRAESEDEN